MEACKITEDTFKAIAEHNRKQEKWDRRFLEMAKLVASWSKDPSTQCGAVIVDQHNCIVSLGFNGFAPGVDDSQERYNNRPVKYRMVVHAEANACILAARRLDGFTLYTWPFSSCSPCTAMMIRAGIKRMVAPVCPPDQASRWGDDLKLAAEQCKEAGVELVLID